MLDQKEEKQYDQLRKLGRKLGIPIPETFLTLEVFDKNGKLLQRQHQRSHSWVRNAYNAMFSTLAGKNIDDALFGAGLLSLKRFAGTVYSAAKCGGCSGNVDTTGFGYRAPAGEDTWGILVGSGVNAESFEDYVLQTQLTEGTGAGEISHVASEVHAITWTGGTLTLKNELIRYFNNNSAPAGDRDVNEVALAFTWLSGEAAAKVMSRDHLASTVTVPSTGQLKVTYTIQLTYPA